MTSLAGCWVTRARLRLERRDGDRGAITTLVAILLAGGVLLGMGALVVDVGQIVAEREQLQTGADAAAMAVARTCALTPASCGSLSQAKSMASLEANDGANAVTVLCGSGPNLTACPPQPTNLTACIGSPPQNAHYVEVRTATLQSNGSTLLPPIFARTLLGTSYAGTTVSACGRVAWGNPSSATNLAITLSVCEWNSMTSNGTVYPTAETTIYLHGTGSTCAANPSGWDAPGGFGYISDSGSCTATVTILPSGGAITGTDPGSSASLACRDALAAAWAARTPLLIPVYDGVTGSGNNTVYHVVGFSEFVLTGFVVGGSAKARSWLTGNYPCSGSQRCLSGYWVTGLLPASGLTNFGGSNFGATVITLVG
jgi:Flp pilus assembly protein TadG